MVKMVVIAKIKHIPIANGAYVFDVFALTVVGKLFARKWWAIVRANGFGISLFAKNHFQTLDFLVAFVFFISSTFINRL